jgi:Uma2 family endonuclease
VSTIESKRWTRVEYERLIDLGVFGPGDRLELLGGQLIVAEPQGAEHYSAVRRVTRALEAAFGPGWEVRPEGPIALDEESEPEPDAAVVPGSSEDYRFAHPARPVLAVEVAVSSLALDRTQKASLYARAGVADYWIVNLVDGVVEVHRDPARDAEAPYGWTYASVDVLSPGASIAPLAAPASRIAVSALVP